MIVILHVDMNITYARNKHILFDSGISLTVIESYKL